MITSIYEYPPILYFCAVIALLFGAVMGSFLNCAAWRIAHGETFLKGRSRCTRCGHVLTPPELIPVLSWLFQKGRCRACGEKISLRYPLTELGFALATLLCLLRFDLTVLCLRNYIFLCCLFCLSLVDLECYIIPDGCCLTAAAAWLLSIPLMALFPGSAAAAAVTSSGIAAGAGMASSGAEVAGRDLLSGILSVFRSEALPGLAAALLFGGGVLAVSLIMDRVLGRDSLGGGDIKLIAVAGLYLKPVGTLFMVMLSCILGLLFYAAGNLAPGEASGGTSGEVSGGTSGEVSGETSGKESGEASGETSGEESGKASGETSGKKSEETSGKAFGETSGKTDLPEKKDAGGDRSEDSKKQGEAAVVEAGENSGKQRTDAPGPGGGSVEDDGEIPEKAFPFGPSIALAAAVMLFFGEPLVSWYLGLLGI